ncbi:MAG: hypothetical protein PHR73_00875 [Candidatus Omnitrophica bacterium]|nr:hypothetical protein [Candidatus Omnitrophota bacterium]
MFLLGFVLGYEFKQGARFPNVQNSNYWDAHLNRVSNKNLAIISAYTVMVITLVLQVKGQVVA